MEQKWIAALRLAGRYLPPVVLAQGHNTAVAQVVQLQVHNTAAAAVLVVAAAHYIALQAAHIVTAVGNLPVQEQ